MGKGVKLNELKTESRIGGSDVVEELIRVLADDGLLVVAGNVVPRDSVIVDVVQDGQAGLAGLVDVVLGVVRLRRLLVASLAPRVISPARWHLVGLGDLVAGGRPEPAEQALGLQIGAALAALEVAESARGPDVGNVVGLDQAEDQIVLLLGLDGHEVHAVFTADVASVQPVELLVGQRGNVTGEEVVLAFVLELLWAWVEGRERKLHLID